MLYFYWSKHIRESMVFESFDYEKNNSKKKTVLFPRKRKEWRQKVQQNHTDISFLV